VGTALGTLFVTTLLDLSWPVRIALVVVVVVAGLGYVLWRHRAEIAAAPSAAEEGAGAAADAPPALSAGTDTRPDGASGEPADPAPPTA
jgi:hypothetical protein